MTAVLVGIDLQRIFADPDSAWAAPRFDCALDGIVRLVDRFAGRTVFTRFVAPAHPIGAWADYYRDWPFALVPAEDPLYDLVDAVAGLDAPVVTETTFGKWGDRLADAMRGADELILSGVSTDCCVLSTALAAADAGIHVRVVRDACAGVSDTDHVRALESMSLYAPLIELTTVDEVLASGI